MRAAALCMYSAISSFLLAMILPRTPGLPPDWATSATFRIAGLRIMVRWPAIADALTSGLNRRPRHVILGFQSAVTHLRCPGCSA